jgi:hypothetical protein
MQEIRTRAGRSGAISFSQMYDCEGWVQTNGYYTSKFFSGQGWWPLFSVGSVSPDESGNNRLLITTTPSPGTSIVGFYKNAGGTQLNLANGTYGANSVVASGYRAQDITRFVAENVARTGTSSSNTVFGISGYQVANSGTIHCMVQF